MTCDVIRSLFSDYVDGALDPAEEDRLGAHLAGCPSCRQALARYEEPLAMLGSAAPDPPPALRERILAAARRQGLVRRGPSLRWLLPVAAGLLVAAGGFWLAGRTRRGSEAATCPGSLARFARIDPRALYAPLPTAEGGERLFVFSHDVVLPELLRTAGPYRPMVPAAARCGEAWRLPLLSPYGDVLELRLTAEPRDGGPQPGSFRVAPDTRRVFYTRVLWREAGLLWSLEGRAPADELLRLATELRAHARVQRG